MKTWEVIKELTEHPEKKFINQEGEKICLFGVEVDIESQLYITDEWEEVKEPVDFMTAFKAYMEGKEIICEVENGGRRFCKEFNGFYSFHEREIENGKWYIED